MAIRRLHHRPRPRHTLAGWDADDPEPPPPRKPKSPLGIRWILLILLGIALTAVAIGVSLRPEHKSAPAAIAGPDRELGPSARGPLARQTPPPTAGDVLGALKRGASGALVPVEGNVIDAISREPVAGVEVVFLGAAGETTTTTAADGSYKIEVAPGDHRAFVRGDFVIAVGLPPHERLPAPPDPTVASAPDDTLAPLVRVADPQRGVDLEVQRSGVVLGKVVDPSGRPVEGAVVRAEVGLWRPVLGTHIAESAADGTFRLEIPGGFYDLVVAHPDYAGAAQVYGQRPNVMVYPTIETEVELSLARGCVITGRAVKADGTPAGGGALERMGGFEADDFAPAGVIADDGSFRYTTVHEEELTLRAWPWKSPPATPHTVTCRDGDRHQLEFVVPDQGPDLSGRIVDANGDPAPNAYLDIRGLEPGTMNQQERADASGDWGVFALPPGQYAITAHVPGEGIATAWVTAPSSGLDLRLSGTGTLYGQVVGVADGATFQLEIETCLAPHALVVMPATTRLVPVENGEFRVDDLPACRLVAHARTPTRTTTIDTDIVAGVDNAYYLDLTPPRSKRVEVSVIDTDGAAVPHAQVMVAPDRGGRGAPPVTADDRGIAVIDAQVGDTVHAWSVDPDVQFARMGRGDVSDAPGSYEEIVVVLDQ